MKINNDGEPKIEEVNGKVEELKNDIKELAESVEQSVKPKPKKKTSFLAVFLIMFFLFSTAAAAYFGYNFMMLKKEMDNEMEGNKQTDATMKAHAGEEESDDMEMGMEDEVEVDEEDVVAIEDIDNTWNQYSNRDFGFSMQLPKEASYYYGDCEMQDDSYRPVAADVSVTAFTSDNGVYFFPEYRYDLLDPETVDGVTNYSDCQRVETNLDYLEDSDNKSLSWFVEVSDVEDEDELLEFIQDKYGSGCGIDDIVPTDDEDVEEVTIETDGLSMEESQCVMNFMYEMRYVASENKVFSWNIGQACNFPTDEANSDCYDQEMTESFEIVVD